MTLTEAERLVAGYDEHGDLRGSNEEDLIEAHSLLLQRDQDNEDISKERHEDER